MTSGDVIGDEVRGIYATAGYGDTGGLGTAAAFLIVDVTYAFTGDRPEPILEAIRRYPKSSGEHAWRAIGALRRVLPAARSAGVPVVYSRNARRASAVQAGGWGRKLATPTGDPRGREDDIVDEIAPEDGDLIIEKTKPSVFFETPLLSWLIQLGVDTLLVGGGTTSGCVRATVTDAFSYNFRVAVVADATFDRADLIHEVSLFDLGQKYADLLDLASARSYLKKLPGR